MEKSSKKFLVYDSGLYSELAVGLTKGDNSVKYFTPYHASFFPKYADFCIGKGFEGIEKVKYFFDNVDETDCVALFDVGGNDMINFLRKHFPDKPIFGSGKGEKLENSRWGLKKIISQLGLPVQKGIKLRGIHALSNYLLKNPNKYVKVDIFRGTINSFYAKDYKSVEQLIEYIEHELGAFSEDFEFVAEDTIKTSQEWGVDTFFWGEDYTDYSYYGCELNKDCYIGKLAPTKELPMPLKETIMKFKPVLKELDWRGCISIEEKIVSEKEHYFLDICARAPNPLGLLYPEMIENWADMVFDIASKKPAKLVSKFKYVGCVPIYSKHTRKSDTQINFDLKYRPNVKFMTAYRKDNRFYAIKDSPEEIACVVTAGDMTVDGLIDKLKKIVDEVDCYSIDKNAVGELDKIKDIIQDAKKVGIFF